MVIGSMLSRNRSRSSFGGGLFGGGSMGMGGGLFGGMGGLGSIIGMLSGGRGMGGLGGGLFGNIFGGRNSRW